MSWHSQTCILQLFKFYFLRTQKKLALQEGVSHCKSLQKDPHHLYWYKCKPNEQSLN